MKAYPFKEKMTNEMRSICDDFFDQDKLKEEFLMFNKKFLEVSDLINRIRLPMKNEEGIDIVHGCRFPLYKMKDYYEIRRDSIKEFIIDKEWIEDQGVSSICYKR